MSSLLDVPAQLALVLSLAASTAGKEPPAAAVAESAAPVVVASETIEGPLRFGERAWLRALKQSPVEAGVDDYATRIFITSGGRFYIPTTDERRRVLAARNDTAFAARVARAFADGNARRMHAALRRAPTAGDLYIAHLLGPETAVRLVKAVADAPDATMARSFPELAGMLPDLMGRRAPPVTVGQFYRQLSGALREPPRLVAIGLKPTMADAPQQRIAGERRPGNEDVAWQTEVSSAKAAPPIQ